MIYWLEELIKQKMKVSKFRQDSEKTLHAKKKSKFTSNFFARCRIKNFSNTDRAEGAKGSLKQPQEREAWV
jgi:hypothetical protein